MPVPYSGRATVGPRGINFRSRLEARWAALLTLIGWPWEYEPDLDLNGWIPDFAITAGTGLRVEVKPGIVHAELEPFKARIEKAFAPEYQGNAWLVGASPTVGLWYTANGCIEKWEPVAVHDVARRVGLVATRVGPADVQRLWIKAGNALQWRRL
jgi:hypothetical protein